MKRYSVGFLFNQNASCVALIHKKRPAWQCGLWNGIGGKIEGGEAPKDAMVREFEEEAWVRVEEWNLFAEIAGADYIISFFRSFDDDKIIKLKTMTDETVMVHQTRRLPHNCVPNLFWLIPLALDRYVSAPLYVDGKVPSE
jgi:8-oxo-dGTP diphosphatase